MKPKSTLRAFLVIAGSTLFSITCASAANYYWDANDGTAGFQDADPGPEGTWSASTPGTATGGFSTDPAGATAISANPAVGTTIDDDIFFGTGSIADLPPLYPYTGVITIDGTVNAKSIYQSTNSPGFAGINSPTVNFPAEGSWEHATTGTVSLPAVAITGASTSMTWKVGFGNTLNITAVTSNGAAKNILTGPGRLVVSDTLNLGTSGTPFVFDGGMLRMNTGILWTKMSELNADHPVTFTPNKDLGIDRRHAFSFEIDNPLNLGTGGLTIEGTTSGDVILSQDYQYSGPTTLTGGITSVETTGNLGLPASNLVFNGGTLKIRGTTLADFSTIGHTVVFNDTKLVGLNIAVAGHTFTADQALNQGTGGLTKSGPGTLTLAAENTYTGMTTVAANDANGGTVNVSGDQSAANGGWSILGNSTVNFQSGSTIMVAAGRNITLANSAGAHSLNVSGTVSTGDTSGLNVRGRSTLNLESGTDWTQNGPLTIQPLNTAYSAAVNVKSGSSFTYNGSANIILAKSTSGGSGGATVNLSGGTFTTARGFSNSAAGTGSGQTRLIFSNGGTLKLSADIPSLIIQGVQVIDSIPTPIPFTVATNTGGGVIDTNGFITAIDVAVSGTGGLTKAGAGTLTLSGTNTYAGDTTVTGGTLVLAADNISNDASTVTIGESGVLQLTFAGTDTVDKLFIGATQQVAGVYGHSSTGATNGWLGVGALDARFAEGSGTLTVDSSPIGSPFQTFMANYPGLTGDDALPEADPDSDGLSNVAEFIMGGTAPNSGSAANRPVEAVISGHLTISMLVPSGTTFAGSPSPATTVQGVEVAVGGSLDLATFTRSVEETVLDPGLPSAPSGYEWHTFRLAEPISSQSRGFLRASFNNL